MDLMIQKMIDCGLTLQDLSHLERLSDPEILATIPKEHQDKLSKNYKDNVVLYMQNWAKLLRDNWLSQNPEISYPTEEKKLGVAVFS